jgi:hypothetical protein
MADIDVVPILGQRLAVGGGICRDGFFVFALDWSSNELRNGVAGIGSNSVAGLALSSKSTPLAA